MQPVRVTSRTPIGRSKSINASTFSLFPDASMIIPVGEISTTLARKMATRLRISCRAAPGLASTSMSAISRSMCGCIVTSNTATCTTDAALPASQSTTFDITLSVSLTYPTDSLTNTAQIASSPVSDPQPGNDEGSDTDFVNRPALSLDKTADTSTYDSTSDTIGYSYLVTNTGNVSLTGPFNVTDNKATATCPGTVTPFDGDHQAGIQVLNTTNFPDARGPLFAIQ